MSYRDHHGSIWYRDNPQGERIFHCGDKGYRTYRHDNGSQCTYDKNGDLVDYGRCKGTYDYNNKSPGWHTIWDVIPHSVPNGSGVYGRGTSGGVKDGQTTIY